MFRPRAHGYHIVYSADTLAGLLVPDKQQRPPRLPRRVTVPILCGLLQYLEPDGSGDDVERLAEMLEADVIRLMTGSEQGRLPTKYITPVDARCACSYLSQVYVDRVFLSGSRREGVSVDQSDIDFMIQLGPFRVEQVENEPKKAKKYQQPRSESKRILLAKPTENPGFFQLWHAPWPRCRHAPLPFHTHSARQLISALTNTMHSHNDEFRRAGRAGPSQEVKGVVLLDNGEQTVDPGTDLVSCVQLLAPLESLVTEFQQRRRPSGQPSASLVAELVRLPPYLVPVGPRGSANSGYQWRVSFSRHEYILLANMQPVQRACLRLLKRCRAAFGLASKRLQSYYLKTALMWKSEQQPASGWVWPGMYGCMMMTIDWVGRCVQGGRMPCYFDSRINLLAKRTNDEMAGLQAAVETMQTKLAPAVLSLFLTALNVPLSKWPDGLSICLNTSQRAGAAQKRRIKNCTWREIVDEWASQQSDQGGVSSPPAKTEVHRKSERDRSSQLPPDNSNVSW